MFPSIASVTTAWLLTYLLHSTVFLGLAWLSARGLSRRRPALEEAVWRFALIAGMVTASVQLASGYEPLAGHWGLTEQATPSVSITAATRSAAPPMSAAVPIQRLAPVADPLPAPARPFPWAALFAGLWSVVALALGARWLAAHVHLRRRLRARPEVVGGDMHALLRRLTGETGIGSVRLTCSSRLPVPIALGLRSPEICVPPRALAALAAEEQEGLLAHELAHLVRRDPFWLAFSHFLASILFFQPLNLVARRRLREISELRSDEWAVGRTGRPLSLARCLAEVAGWSFQPLRSLTAPGMADRPSHLAHRIRRLLEEARSPERAVRPVWLAAGMALLLLAGVAAVPGVSLAAPEKAPEKVPERGSAVAAGSPASIASMIAGTAAPATHSRTGATHHGSPAEVDAPDLDIDVEGDPVVAPDLDLDVNLGDLDLDPQLADLGSPGALDEHGGLSAEEEKALDARMDALNEQIENRLRPQMEELQHKIEKQMEEFEKSPSMQKLRAEADEMSRRARPSDAEIQKLRAEAEKLSAEGRLSAADRDRIRQQARALADKYKMSEKDRTEIQELARQARQEHELFMKEHGQEIEALRKQMHEQAAAMREDIRRQIENDPQMRALRERRHSDMEHQREEMKKKRDEMRKERDEMRERQKKEKGEVDRHSRQAIRGGVEGGVAGGVEGGVAGGVEGGVQGGVQH
jgi:beta-lactamase regulating signal transducer with metallopeptidase domain